MTAQPSAQIPADDTPNRPSFAEHCVMRWSLDYILRMLHETAVTFDGDLISGIIFLALIRANTQHLAEATQRQYSLHNGVIPDEARRPATVKSISDSLNLPYETVRRHLGKLADKGYCVRSERRGFLASEDVLRRPLFAGVLTRNLGHFHQMIDRLNRAGLDMRFTGERT